MAHQRINPVDRDYTSIRLIINLLNELNLPKDAIDIIKAIRVCSHTY
jgi:hypothetical protein